MFGRSNLTLHRDDFIVAAILRTLQQYRPLLDRDIGLEPENQKAYNAALLMLISMELKRIPISGISINIALVTGHVYFMFSNKRVFDHEWIAIDNKFVVDLHIDEIEYNKMFPRRHLDRLTWLVSKLKIDCINHYAQGVVEQTHVDERLKIPVTLQDGQTKFLPTYIEELIREVV